MESARPASVLKVDDAPHLRPGVVDGAIYGEAGCVDTVFRIADEAAFDIHPDQVRCRHLLEGEAETIHEEMMLAPGNARRDMIVDKLVPAILLRQAVTSGKLDPDLPLVLAHGNIPEQPLASHLDRASH